MMDENFAVFILTHGRAENVLTLNTLKKAGYSGKTYLVIDDEDAQEDLYREKFGDMVIQFCKKDAAKTTDVMTPSRKRNAVVFARNKCWKIAESLGLTHFCVLDDWFMRTDRPFRFVGLTNEDTNMYVSLGGIGKLMFTVTNVSVNQMQTQDNPGGLTEIYKQDGTFVKSFYSVMARPDCVKVAAMGDHYLRMHHNVEWDYCVPKILNEKWKKV